MSQLTYNIKFTLLKRFELFFFVRELSGFHQHIKVFSELIVSGLCHLSELAFGLGNRFIFQNFHCFSQNVDGFLQFGFEIFLSDCTVLILMSRMDHYRTMKLIQCYSLRKKYVTYCVWLSFYYCFE